MAVISTMLGIPEADQDEVRERSDAMLHREAGDSDDITPEGIDGATTLYGYFDALDRASAARSPADDMTERARDRRATTATALSHNEVLGFLLPPRHRRATRPPRS